MKPASWTRRLVAPTMATVWFVVALTAFALLVSSASSGSQPLMSWPLVWAVVLAGSLGLLVRSRTR